MVMKMRILVVAQQYFPNVGGVEYVIKSTSEHFAMLGNEVLVVAGDCKVTSPTRDTVKGIMVLRWPMTIIGGLMVPKMRRQFVRTVSSQIPISDVLHLHSVHATTTSLGWEAWKQAGRKCRLVVTPYYHGTGHTLIARMLWRFRWGTTVRRVLEDASAVHTVSKSEANLVRQDFGIKCIPIENGVEDEVESTPWEPSGYALFAGRIEKYKNIERLARVCRILNSEYGQNLRLVVNGRGSYESQLQGALSSIGVATIIEPFQEFDSYVRTLSHASLLGLLSEKESYPQSVNEANSIGVPVLLARPWGENFEGRPRTAVVSLTASDREIAGVAFEMMSNSGRQNKARVPNWRGVALEYINRLYA